MQMNGPRHPRSLVTPVLIGAGAAALWMAISGTARADPLPEARAIAERLYEQGRSQMAAKSTRRRATALRKAFVWTAARARYSISPLAIVSWTSWREPGRNSGRRPRRHAPRVGPTACAFAQRQLAEIEPRLAQVVISLGAVDATARPGSCHHPRWQSARLRCMERGDPRRRGRSRSDRAEGRPPDLSRVNRG